MRKSTLFTFFIIWCTAFLMAFNNPSVNKVEIKGLLVNLPKTPAKLYLFRDHKLKDSSIVKNGTYQFSCNVSGISNVIIKASRSLSLDGNRQIELLIGKGIINLRSEHSLSEVTISGEGVKLAQEYRNAVGKTLIETDKLNDIVASEKYKTDALLQADVTIRISYLNESRIDEMVQYLSAYPNSPAASYMALSIYEHNYPAVATAEKLMDKIPLTQRAWLNTRIVNFKAEKESERKRKSDLEQAKIAHKDSLERMTSPGSYAKDFTQTDTAGKEIKLSSYRGKYVLIDFWASWCHPCREENPTVKRAFRAFKDKGFDVLGISIDGRGFGSRESWIKAIKTDGLEWTQILDLKDGKNEIAKLYNVTAIPRNFLIDPNGVIIARDLRGEALNIELEKIFK